MKIRIMKVTTLIVILVLICFSCDVKKKHVFSLLTNDNVKYWTYFQQYKENDSIKYYDSEIYYYFDTRNVWKVLAFTLKDTSWYLTESSPRDVIPCNDYMLINDSILSLCHSDYLIKYISNDSLVIGSKINSKRIDIFKSIKGIPQRKRLKRLHDYQIIDMNKINRR